MSDDAMLSPSVSENAGKHSPVPDIKAPAVTIRVATSKDIPWLLNQLRSFAAFYDSKHSLFPDEDEAEQFLSDLIDLHPFFIAENGQPIGFIAGSLAPHPYNRRVIQLSEMFWWVDEDHRGGRAGLLLLDAFIRFGKTVADQISMTLETNSPVNPATLERRGFREMERSYLMEVC